MLYDRTLDVFPDALFGLDDARVAITQDVGIEGEQLIHGILPRNGITLEVLKEGCADVLPEENPFFSRIKIDCNRPGRVARYVDPIQRIVAEGNLAFFATDFHIYGKGFQKNTETPRCCHLLVPSLHN